MRVAARAFPSPYSHPKSPHRFTQSQLAACLVLKTLWRQGYVGFVEMLELMPPVQEALGLRAPPHPTTLFYFFRDRLRSEQLEAMLKAVLELAAQSTATLAVDSTGLSTTAASAHFMARNGRLRRGYVQMTVAVAIDSQLVAAVSVRDGPHGDANHLLPILKQAQRNGAQVREVLADKGYDSSLNHRLCREVGIVAWIPPIVHSPTGRVRGEDRARCLPCPPIYGKRWHVESVFSATKRRTGAAVAARRPDLRQREAILKAVSYSVHR